MSLSNRVDDLAERFNKGKGGRKPTSERERKRHSLYFDKDLLPRIWSEHVRVNAAILPITVDKATFMETLLEVGLDHIDEVKEILSKDNSTQEK